MENPQPRQFDLVSPTELHVHWRDGVRTVHGARELRLACPCAQCVDEGSGRKILDDASVPQDIRILHLDPVGRYGVSPTWSDGHRTGIFTWPALRQLGGAGEDSR